MTSPRFRYAASLRLEGAAIFGPPDLDFNIGFPYTYCRVCGTVFQRPQDRHPGQSLLDLYDNMEIRRNWSLNHAKSHPQHLHNALQTSGLWALPEATEKLASYGIYAVGSGVLNEEVRDALEGSKPTPKDDVEGSRY